MNHELVPHCEMCGGLRSTEEHNEGPQDALATPAYRSEMDDDDDLPEETIPLEEPQHADSMVPVPDLGSLSVSPTGTSDNSPLCCMPSPPTPNVSRRIVVSL